MVIGYLTHLMNHEPSECIDANFESSLFTSIMSCLAKPFLSTLLVHWSPRLIVTTTNKKLVSNTVTQFRHPAKI